MNTFLSRLNTIFAFTLSTMACLTFCCFLTTLFINRQTTIEIGTPRVTVKNMPDYTAERDKNDLGLVFFDLDADFSSVFNWNVKQLFLYLTAEYKTDDHKLNQVVLWDKILLRGENSIISLRSANSKYYFWDYGNGLRGNDNVTLYLSWNTIPNAGTLPLISGNSRHRIHFPDSYSLGRY